MKNILIVYGGAKNKGGIRSYIKDLSSGLKESKVINLNFVSVGTWELTEELISEKNFNTFILPRSIFGLFASRNHFKNIDKIVTMGMVSNIFGRFWGLRFGIPVTTIVHSDWRTDYEGKYIRKFLFFITDRLLRFQSRNYVVVSQYLRDELIKDGIPVNKIIVIYNGVDTEKFTGSPHSLKSSKYVVGSVGRLHRVKNYESLIKAVQLSKFTSWDLKIIGEGQDRARLEALVSGLGLLNRVELEGQVTNVREELAGLDIYVQPSFSEGFGLAVVEAMLCGLPVIVTPAGALKELVSNGKYGYITKGTSPKQLAEAIDYLIEHHTIISDKAMSGQKYARENFNKEIWLSKIEKTLAS